jgi:CheY-like chemotaxis protein
MAEPVSTTLLPRQSRNGVERTTGGDAMNDAISGWTGAERLDGVRVLLVDAEPQIRDMVADTLRLCGAQVTGVDSAVAGLASLKREKPDALLSSIFMPDRDGYWLIREVRKLPRDQGGDVPAAAFTGLTAPEDRLACLRAGFQYHVPKPVALSRLAGVVALMALRKPEINGHRAMTASSTGSRLSQPRS